MHNKTERFIRPYYCFVIKPIIQVIKPRSIKMGGACGMCGMENKYISRIYIYIYIYIYKMLYRVHLQLYKALFLYIRMFRAQPEDGSITGSETCCCYK